VGATLHIVEPPEEVRSWTFQDDPGACFRWPPFDEDGREAWCIVLPNRAGLWWTTYRADAPPHRMWDVSGVPPLLSVHPSIDAGSRWHGWIKNGEMSP